MTPVGDGSGAVSGLVWHSQELRPESDTGFGFPASKRRENCEACQKLTNGWRVFFFANGAFLAPVLETHTGTYSSDSRKQPSVDLMSHQCKTNGIFGVAGSSCPGEDYFFPQNIIILRRYRVLKHGLAAREATGSGMNRCYLRP